MIVSAPSEPLMSSTSMNWRATVFSSVTSRVTREYIPNLQDRKPGRQTCVLWLAGFLPVPRLTADSAGRRSCQGWPEATAERLGLDWSEALRTLPRQRGTACVSGLVQYRCDETCHRGWTPTCGLRPGEVSGAGGLVQLAMVMSDRLRK